ncbi:MAG: V-type ATP synthase subunit E family protein [Eubacteriales bacterium]|nr:V-type ATP synthase subunit E family protein [Eubacteriales bacterium]
MDGINKIREKVLSDAQAKADAIIAEAERQAKRIREATEEALKQGQSDFETESERLRMSETARKKSETAMEARRISLQAKNELIRKVKEEALKRLQDLPESEKFQLYLDLIKQEAEDGAELTLSAADQGLKQRLVEAADVKIRAVSEPGNFEGGIVLRQGKVSSSMTFTDLLNKTLETEITEIAKILYGSASAQ